MNPMRGSGVYPPFSFSMPPEGLAAALGPRREPRRRLQPPGDTASPLLQLKSFVEQLDRDIASRKTELQELQLALQAKQDQLRVTEQILQSTQSSAEPAGRFLLLGQRVANVVAELSGPLSEFRTFARNADACLANGQLDGAVRNIGRLKESCEHMAGFVGQLKRFSHTLEEATSKVDLAGAIQACIQLLQSDFKRQAVELKLQIVDKLVVSGNLSKLEQVLICLLRNALEAAQLAPQRRQVKLVLLQEGGQAVIKVRDSGAGLSPEVAQRLFQPFFSTKPWGRALGLGLSVSANIVKGMEGQLSGANHPDGGAEFAVRLPLAPDG
jgi:two-component system C4-dicarboxylate transport sensor histidine kinase DctB